MKQAVETNLDLIHDRLPKPLRAGRRRLQVVLMWSGRVGLAVAVILAAVGTSEWTPAASQPGRSGGAEASPVVSRSVAPMLASRAAVAADLEDPMSFAPGVLALGVRRVIIDAGHGGVSAGTSAASGVDEKTLTLDIAQRMYRRMIALGYEAVLTRQSDETISLQQRAAIANERKGDVFVSIHLNSFEPASARGIETYYVGPSDDPALNAMAERENQHSGYSLSDMRSLLERIFADARRDESRRLARAVQQALVGAMRHTNPALADRGIKKAPFVVLVATEMPAILAEVSCLSNSDEARRLNTPDYREAIAEALVSGVASFARTHG
jgi:N-acetylmuramoyl-L-alanine amidase